MNSGVPLDRCFLDGSSLERRFRSTGKSSRVNESQAIRLLRGVRSAVSIQQEFLCLDVVRLAFERRLEKGDGVGKVILFQW